MGGAVHFDSFHQQDADVNVDLFVCGQPDFIIDVGLFEDDAGALLEVGEEAAGNFDVADEEGVEAHDIEGFFVDPDDAAEFLDDFFDEAAGLEFRVRLEIEDQDVLAAEAFAAGIDELAGAEESVYGDVFVFFFLLFLLVLLAGAGFLARALLEFVNLLQDTGVFLFWASVLRVWPLILTRVETSVPSR